MRFRRRPPGATDELRSGAKDTDPGWDAALAAERGIESHESTDEGPRIARRDRPLRLPRDR